MPTLCRTTSEHLARLERTSKLNYMSTMLAQIYADAGKWHDPTEQERIRAIITDMRVESATLHEDLKQELMRVAPSEAQHLTVPPVRFARPHNQFATA